MKNITLSVDEKTLSAVRRVAADRDSSVNALVREYLETLAAQDDRAARARENILELARRSKGRLGSKQWTREDLNDRGSLSR